MPLAFQGYRHYNQGFLVQNRANSRLRLFSRELKESEKVASYSTKFSRPATTSINNVNSRELYIFTKTATQHMKEHSRRIPLHILDDIIKYPIVAAKDPCGTSNAIMHYSQMWRNKGFYNAEVLYNQNTNTISHFKYSREALGPLKRIEK